MPRLKTLLGFQVAPESKYQPETTQKEQYEHDGSADVLPRTHAVVIWLFVNRHSRWLAIELRATAPVYAARFVLSAGISPSSLDDYHGHSRC
jgi:hypothetical protein